MFVALQQLHVVDLSMIGQNVVGCEGFKQLVQTVTLGNSGKCTICYLPHCTQVAIAMSIIIMCTVLCLHNIIVVSE